MSSEIVIYAATTDAQINGSNRTYLSAHLSSAAFDSALTSLRVGQATGYLVHRAFLEFDTSAVVGTIIKAVLRLTCKTDASATDFYVRVRKHDWASPIGTGNREANYDGAVLATLDVSFADTADLAVDVSHDSPDLDLTWISRTGMTRYALVSNRDTLAFAPTNDEYVLFYSAEQGGAAGPQLVLTVAEQPRAKRGELLPGMRLWTPRQRGAFA